MNDLLATAAVISALVLSPVSALAEEGASSGSTGTHASAMQRMGSAGRQGGTAMHWMAFSGDAAGVMELIVAGEDVNQQLKTGGTPLHLAAYKGHLGVAKLLIEHGAEVNARTREGLTPLDWAQRNGHEKVAMLLIAHGAGQPQQAPKANSQPDPGEPAEEDDRGTAEDASAPAVAQQVPEEAVKPDQAAEARDNAGRTTEDLAARDEETADVAADAKPGASTPGYRIQLGAFSSERRALAAWEGYRKKYPQILGSRELILDQVTVKGKQYHRVQTGPMSRSDAWEICARLQKASQACAVMTREPS